MKVQDFFNTPIRGREFYPRIVAPGLLVLLFAIAAAPTLAEIIGTDDDRWTWMSTERIVVPGAFGDVERQTTQAGAYGQCVFSGTGVRLFSSTAPGRGAAAIYVNDQLVGTFSMSGSTTRRRVVIYEATNLRRTTNVIRVQQIGHTPITIDAIEVQDNDTDHPPPQVSANVPFPEPEGVPVNLEPLTMGYPQYFQFRRSESLALRRDFFRYEDWEDLFNRHPGIIGKVLEEEHPRRADDGSLRALKYFQNFARDYPEKLVLLHFNGRARDMNFGGDRYFPGHFLYYGGCLATEDILATIEDTVIHVESARSFALNRGVLRERNDDVVLIRLNPDGSLNWNEVEYTSLISRDTSGNTITVRRAQYGTEPLSFEAGKVYLAAPVALGPYGPVAEGHNLNWHYNFSSDCPRDPNGKTASDVFVEEMAEYFAPGGILQDFDGLQLDIHVASLQITDGRGIDSTGDRMTDNGFSGGENRFAAGVTALAQKLRAALGSHRLIMADGERDDMQRNYGIFNGIEFESFPRSIQFEPTTWSASVNRIKVWMSQTYGDPFCYINFKYRDESGHTQLPPNLNRLYLSTGPLLDVPIAIFNYPSEPGNPLPQWDELKMGLQNRTGWLGMPTGDLVNLVLDTPDLLAGNGQELSPSFIASISPVGDASVSAVDHGDKPSIRIQANNHGRVIARLPSPVLSGDELTISARIWVKDTDGVTPRQMGRLATLRILNSASEVIDEQKINLTKDPHNFIVSFGRLSEPPVRYELEVEGVGDVFLNNMSVYAGLNPLYRDFENGVILANPSDKAFEFDMDSLFPGQILYRLSGSANQDPFTNNGARIEGTVTIPAADALFLSRDVPPSPSEKLLFYDTFNGPDGGNLNSGLQERTEGSLMALAWDAFLDPQQNDYYTIFEGRLHYMGPGSETGHPEKVFLVDAEDGSRMDFGSFLAGMRYSIEFSVENTGTDGPDAIGFSISEAISGGGQGLVSLRQLFSRSIVDVVADGSLTRIDEFSTAENNRFRIDFDESVSQPVFKVYRNQVLIFEGEFTPSSAERYLFLQIVDSNRNGTGFVDEFRLILDPMKESYGPGVFSDFELLPGGWIDSDSFLGLVNVNAYPLVYIKILDAYAYVDELRGTFYLHKTLPMSSHPAVPGPGIFAQHEMFAQTWVDSGEFLGWVTADKYPWIYIQQINAFAWVVSPESGWILIYKESH
jgi:hypothetical protein